MAGSVDIAGDIGDTGRMTKFKFLFNEKSRGKGGTGYVEPSLTVVIRHIFALSYRLGTSPSTVKFDDQKGNYFLIGPAWRKVLCLAMLILSNLHYEALDMLAQPKAGITKGEAAMLKFLAISYNCFYFAFYWTLFKEGRKLLELLNGVLNTLRKIRERGRSSLSRTKILGICSALVILCLIMAFTEAIGALEKSSEKPITSLGDVVDIQARLFLLCVRSWNATDVREYCLSCEQPALVVNGLGALIFLWLWWGELCWTCGYCMIMCWAITIWSLLKSFHYELRRSEIESTNVILKKIRLFNEICALVDKLNDVFGWTILFSVFVGVIHLSVYVFTIFKEDAGALETIGVLLSFFGFGAKLWVTAMVHREAKSIGKTMRNQFEAVPSESEYCLDRTEAHNALVLVLQDLNAGNVGIKGHEFFTCTFGFIGTVLGTIATYSFIVIQLQA